MTANRLAEETSPYLLQHKDNPVHWQPWGTDALETARREDKPILLSVGYAACHWCHVMAHESFENDDIAGVMNDHFVSVKVDREERPDVDNIYQTALAVMGEHGGWPLTMFLTPDGEPFWGGTYFPPSPKFGRPGFRQVLESVAKTYTESRDRIGHNVTALKDALAKASQPDGGAALTTELLDETAGTLLRAIDPKNGGTMGAPKFPQPSTFRLLWHAYFRTGSPVFRDAVTLTLDRISMGGIYDHLGGGYARYAVEDTWLVPHFEKMLYDNALLLELLTDAWRSEAKPLYAERVRETIGWLEREMKSDLDAAGRFGFASAFDADSEGEEGKFYVWTDAVVDGLLGPEADAFKEAYDVTPGGNWEGKTILNRTPRRELADADTEATLARGRQVLFAERAKRVPPQRDDKVLADWNGLAIAALAHAGRVFDEPKWIELAAAVFDFVVDNLSTGDGARLWHAWRDGRARHPAVIDDYANLARAGLMLYEATGAMRFLETAQAWVAEADRHHWDADGGGYFLPADDTADLITRPKTVLDNATPSGNGTMADVLARLYHLTGDDGYRARAERLITTFAHAEAMKNLYHPTLLCGWELLQRATQVVVVGRRDDPATTALYTTAVASAPPTGIVTVREPDSELPAGHPAADKGMVDGTPAAYVCVGPACGLPSTDPETLRAELARAAA